MFSVTVRDHFMVAHSFRGEVFGPAQRLHGATFIVDATFKRAELDADNIVVDIGLAGQELGKVTGGLNYRNLDDDPDFAGVNTSTEYLAKVVADRLADRIHTGALGEGARGLDGITVTLHESHIAWASYEALAVTPADATTTAVHTVHVVMPGDVDDPAVPSGGNTYDLRVCQELPRSGWQVREHAVPGTWPQPGAAARAGLARLLGALAEGTVVLLDGLVACAVPDIVVPEAARLRLVVLVHLPLGDETGLAPHTAADLDARERRTLRAATAVVATSTWAARRLTAHHGLAPGQVHVAVPGVDRAPVAPGTDGVSRLLCVASVTPRKGQHRLVGALATVADLPWSCVCVGGLHQDPAYVVRLRTQIAEFGFGERVRLAGPQHGEELEASYAAADLLVLTSYAETYGMVVTEALARGIPVLATAVDGLPEAIGHAPDGSVPGLLVQPGNLTALTGALRRWFGEPELRKHLKISARRRRATLEGWEMTSRNLAAVLERLPAQPRRTA